MLVYMCEGENSNVSHGHGGVAVLLKGETIPKQTYHSVKMNVFFFLKKKCLQTSLLNKKAFKLNAISKNASHFHEIVHCRL